LGQVSAHPNEAMNSIKRMKLTGAAILVSRGTKILQAAPAAYPYRSSSRVGSLNETYGSCQMYFLS
jgi:hypothetical protein